MNIHYGLNILKYPCLPKVESIILQPETLTLNHKYQVFVWIHMDEPWHQNKNIINVMQKKSHQFVFINPYYNAQEHCGYLVTKRKGKYFLHCINPNCWAYREWCVLLKLYRDGQICFKYYFFITTLVDIYIMSCYFYGPQRINFTLDFLS